MKVRIIEILPDNKYIAVDKNSNLYTAILSGNLKKNKIYVGDFVEIEKNYDKYVIDSVYDRSNFLIRPPVANIDFMILCLSIDSPSPDFMLLDKQLINCALNNIKPIICLTKMDLLNDNNKKVYDYIKKVYEKLCYKVIYISAKEQEDLYTKFKFSKGKVYAFSGNSGVGKSTIISKLTFCKSKVEIGKISAKTNKGKNTTKYVKMYNTHNDAFIVDTPGFSGYDLIGVDYKNLKKYYKEFEGDLCKYLDCSHTLEGADECEVKKKVSLNLIDKERYNRYLYMYDKLKQADELKYKR